MGSSTGSLLVEDDDGVRNVLKAIRRRAAFHSEDEYRLRERMHLRVEGDPRSHPVWRDASCRAHVHAAAGPARARDRQARARAARHDRARRWRFSRDHKDVATVEATPHHLTLAAPDCYERLGTLRADESAGPRRGHRDGIWQGLAQGVIDVLGSDHAPHTREEKAQVLSRRRLPA